ncbi:MAG: class II fructose-bisphosphate aldolase [Oscillospiraceae bacterium]|nr:class II fructose-bisphosphate aldolase [Oscillospiraceae bacterium]
MIATLNETLAYARDRQRAVGSFNTPNLECVCAVIGAAEELNVPVILLHAQVHEPVAPLEVIGPVMVLAAKRAKVPVCVHLDHCETLSYLRRALEIGFTGIMYDGSALSYEDNVTNTIEAVRLSRGYGAGVEAELGQLAHREGGEDTGGPVYTDPDLAARFASATGIDCLAPSFGTAHGIYKSAPVLNLELVKRVGELVGLPLVMHGGSGVSREDYRTAIRNGIRKVNYYTYMAREGVRAAKRLLDSGEVTFYHDVAMAAQEAMRVDALQALRLFNGMG